MSVSDEDFKELRDAVRDLASHVAAALAELEVGIDAVAQGGAAGDVLAQVHAAVKRTNSHISDVRIRLESHRWPPESQSVTGSGRRSAARPS